MLFLVVRVGFPLESEVDRLLPGASLLVPSSVEAELDGLARSLTTGAVAARALAARYRTVPTTERGDEGVIQAATGAGAWVATADRELRRRLRIRGVGTLVPRDRHRLEAIPPRPPAPVRARARPLPDRRGGNG